MSTFSHAWYIKPEDCYNIMFLNIIHRPVLLKTQHFWDWVGFTWRRRQNPVSETLFFVWKQDSVWNKNMTMENVQNVLMYHRHKLLDRGL
jgi:hypothetical protein